MKKFSKAAVLSIALYACFLPAFAMAKESHKRCHTCRPPTVICSVPYRITESGKYCVDKDLVYTGSGAAIEVLANNVSINFNNHSLTLTNLAATGIHADSVFELVVENDRLTFDAPLFDITGSLIHLNNVNKATFDNLYLFNTSIGVLIENSSDIHLINSQIREVNAANVLASPNVNGLVIDNCNMYNTLDSTVAVAGIFLEGVRNCRISNSQLFNTDIFGRIVTDCIVDNISAITSDPDYIFSALQLGSSGEEAIAESCIVRNSTFTTDDSSEGIDIVRVFGVLIENCTITGTGIYPLILGPEGSGGSTDVKVQNCVIRGGSAAAIVLESGPDAITTGIEISNCLIEYGAEANIDIGHIGSITGCVIKDNTIQYSLGDGILTNADTATGCTILNNVIANNCGRAVYLATGCTQNLVADNKVLRNGDGIIDDGVNNLLDDNTEFTNNLVCSGGGITAGKAARPQINSKE